MVILVAARSLTQASTAHFPKPLLALMIVAGAVILFSLPTEGLLLGWLFLAPLLQESAGKVRAGHLLSLALYTAPPVVFVLKTVMTRGRRPEIRWIDVVPALYVGFVLFSLLTTATGLLTASPVGTLRTFYQTFALGALVYYVVAFWPGRPLSAVRLCAVLLAGAALQAAMSIVEWRTGWNLWHDTSWQRGVGDVRSVGTLTNPGLLGAFIGVGLVIALAVLCWDGPRALRRLSILMLVVGPLGLFATLTRGPILATVVACVPIMLLAPRSRLLGLGALALVALIILTSWGSIQSSSVYKSRITNSQNVDVRLALQQVSLRLFELKPILGWGFGSFDKVKTDVQLTGTIGSVNAMTAVQWSTSHDTFLTVLVEYGVVGFLLLLLPWVWICGRAVRRVWRHASDPWLNVAGVGVVAVVALTGATLDLRFFSFVPMIVWLLVGLMRRSDTREPLPVTNL